MANLKRYSVKSDPLGDPLGGEPRGARINVRLHDPMTAALSIGGSLIGGVMSSNAAQSAADTQANAADRAAQIQQGQYTQTRNDLAPYRNLGSGAINPLLQAMGYNVPAQSAAPTYDQLYQQLLPQFTKTAPSTGQGDGGYVTVYDGSGSDQDTGRQVWMGSGNGGGGATTVDTAGLNAAVQAAMQGQQTQSYSNLTVDPNNPLQKQFSFTPGDLTQTPGYQFNYGQGMRAVDNSAAAQGLGLSGAQMKGAMRFASGLADTTYQNQFGNALNTYNTNYNTATQNVNRLLGLVGNGQNAANQTGAYGIQTAGNVGNMINSAGQSQASGTVGRANALSGALGGVGNNALVYSMLGKGGFGGSGASTLYGNMGSNGMMTGGANFPMNVQL
jgi:hypothetical protein